MRRAPAPVAALGSLPRERQWGTVREDYSADGDAWALLHATTRRGRAPIAGARTGCRRLRRSPAAVLRARPLERPRPDPQGAAVRPDEQRGQPRRGRQGVLLLPRLDADALVHALPVQVPAGRVPVRRARRRRIAAGARRSSSTSCSRPASSTRTATSTSSSSTRRRRRGPAHPDHGHNRGPGAADAPPPAHAVVPQHLVLATATRRAPGPARVRRPGAARHRGASGPRRAAAWSAAGARAAVHRERDQHQRLRASRTGRRTSRTASTSASSTARRRRQPGRDGHEGSGPLRARRRGRRVGGGPAPAARAAGRARAAARTVAALVGRRVRRTFEDRRHEADDVLRGGHPGVTGRRRRRA